jgi:hypothetical protein
MYIAAPPIITAHHIGASVAIAPEFAVADADVDADAVAEKIARPVESAEMMLLIPLSALSALL